MSAGLIAPATDANWLRLAGFAFELLENLAWKLMSRIPDMSCSDMRF